MGTGTSGLASPRPAWVPRAVVWLPAVLMLCFGLAGLDRHAIWRDEAASLVAARRTLPQLWSMLGHVETVHAVYYTLLHGWLQLGSGEAWARMPSVLAMTAAAGLVGVLGARLASVPVGLVAGLLFAVNPSASFYAQEARSTALVGACALLSTWVLVRAVERRSTWWSAWWTAYAVTGAVLVGLNLLAVLVPVAHAVTLLCWGHRHRVLASWAVASVPAGAVALTLVLVTRRQPYQVGWIPTPGAASVRDLVHLALAPSLPVALLVLLLAVGGIVAGRSTQDRRLVGLALPLAAVPPAALLAGSFVQPLFVARYVFPSIAGVVLLAGLGVVRLGGLAGRRTRRPALVLALVAAVLVLLVAVGGLGTQRLDRTPASRADDLTAAAAVVAAAARPGDATLFLPGNRQLVALAYPDAFAGLGDVGLAPDAAGAGDLTGNPLPLDVALRNLSASSRVWAIGRPGLALLPSEQVARAELAALDRDFVAVDRTGAQGVGITLYVRRPASS